MVIAGIGSAGLPLYRTEELQQSPSIRDGLPAHQEVQWRRQYTHFISDVGKTLEVPQWAIYTAIFLCHHYFVKRSMIKNDRYLVATACLYLASKVQESPKYLRDVIKQAEIKKWARWQQEHPMEPKRWEDMIHLEAMRDQVLVAERAVLYTISFQLRIKTPYPDILAFQQHIVEAYKHDIVNIAWSLVNDSLQTTLSLRYPPEKLAATCLFLAHEIHGVPLPSSDGKGFCELANILDEELQDIANELLAVYITVVQQNQPGTPGRGSEQQPSTQPMSPDETHLQLQDNRVRLVMRQQQRPQAQYKPGMQGQPVVQQQQHWQQPSPRMLPQTPQLQPQLQQQQPMRAVQQQQQPLGDGHSTQSSGGSGSLPGL